MTDKLEKPATPGMAEVSAKFVHEAEAAVETATSTDEALSALWQEHEGATAQYRNAARETNAAVAISDGMVNDGSPEYRTAVETSEVAEQHQQGMNSILLAIETRMAKIPARTVAGALLKLRMVGVEIAGEFNERREGDFQATSVVDMEELTLSALADLERLAGEVMPIGAASVIEDPVLMLKREWEARWGQYVGAPDNSDETTDPLHDRVNETAYEIFQTPATTLAGVAFKLVLWARQHVKHGYEGVAGWSRPPVESYSPDLDHLPVVSALHDLERMSSRTIAPEAPAVPVIDEPLLAMRREWFDIRAEIAAWPAEEDDPPALWNRRYAIESRILTAESQTLLGALVQIEIWADNVKDGPADFAIVIAGRVAEQLPTRIEGLLARDAAIFAAIAEYDRLAAIEQELEHRAEIFRPGIPEAEEADKAYKAAREEASRAWGKACGIPATTQAGLFAKLQAIIRFMGDIEEDDLHEDEWSIIKADVQRIAGETRL